MAISKRTRFEVFKRDGFECQYCGSNRDDDGVKLHVDHIIPRKEGGGDEIENLVTACQDCNLGKGAKLLDSRAPVPDVSERVAALQERRDQIAKYIAAKQEEERAEAETRALEERMQKRRDDEFSAVWNYWFEIWGEDELPRWYLPYRATLKRYIESIGASEVVDAMNITAGKFRGIKADAVRYFVGVCRHKEADSEGRSANCSYCGGRIILTKEQVDGAGGDAGNWTWHHVSCKEEAREKEQERGRQYWLRNAEAFYEGDEEDYISEEVAAWDKLAEAAGY